jgi:hypothetical protein
MNVNLIVGLSGEDNQKLFFEVYDQFFKKLNLPSRMSVDDETIEFSLDAVNQALVSYSRDILIKWEGSSFLTIKRNQIVIFEIVNYDLNAEAFGKILSGLSFSLASFGTLYLEWMNPFTPYESPTFSNFHMSHGWGCAFKGEGYKRLVSRRWLDYGSWKQIKCDNDTELIQFHQLGLNSEEAIAQSKEGHQLMGISKKGGFIQQEYVFRNDLNGIYLPSEKILKIIVHGREIEEVEKLDACALRYLEQANPLKPIKNVAFVFMEEKNAQKYLHGLWLRGLECRAIIGGVEVLLNNNYSPTPNKPNWVIME